MKPSELFEALHALILPLLAYEGIQPLVVASRNVHKPTSCLP